MNLLSKLVAFMYGRYGTDELSHFLLIVYIIIFFIHLFFRIPILFILELLLIFIVFYRTFSKKIFQRKKENQIFLKFKRILTKPFEIMIKNQKDKDHVYKKCHKCKTILRLPLPSKHGIKHTKCPKCKKKLTIFTLKYQKIEIIKTKK